MIHGLSVGHIVECATYGIITIEKIVFDTLISTGTWKGCSDREMISINYKPVIITESMLLKLGFKYNKGVFRLKLKGGNILRGYINGGEFSCAIDEFDPCGEVSDIVPVPTNKKYVHQLQILVFGLTDEMLKI